MADFRGHVNGASAFSLGYVGVMTYVLAITGALDQPNGGDWFFYGLMAFGIGLVFGIWPDVDVNSKAQKFFYRIFHRYCDFRAGRCALRAEMPRRFELDLVGRK